MRTATIYNFLLEANLITSAAILLMILIRKFLRKPLGNQLIYFLWLLVAIRLLCPLALSNPFINEFRPYYMDDLAIRPIAAQIKVRLTDAVDDIENLAYSNKGSVIYQGANRIVNGMYHGTLPRLLLRLYLYGAGAVLLLFGISNVRFRRKLKINRIEQISGKLEEQYLAICRQRKAKPIPVWFVDPLPSACLVGVIRPYIAMPLTAEPQEAVHVLTHEVCHYKGRDHWVSLLRLLCCVIHWFNPLVWLAAFMSRTDGELACDSRVVRGLALEDRLNYTNTLVLSASRRYAPGMGVLATGMTMTGKRLQHRVRSILNNEHTVKWLAAAVAALACAACVAAFFTAEYNGFPQMPAASASVDLPIVRSLQSKEEAQQFARAFFTESSLALDVSDAVWDTSETDTAYTVRAVFGPEGQSAAMEILKNGTIISYSVPSDMDRAAAVWNFYSQDTARQEEVAAYIISFLGANQPGAANTVNALRFSSEGAFGTQRFVTFCGANEISNSAYLFVVQVTPQVQIVRFQTDPIMTEYLLEETNTAAAASLSLSKLIQVIDGLWTMDITEQISAFSAPPADAILIGEALNLAVQAIEQTYGESDITRFYVQYGYTAQPADNTYEAPYWNLRFRNLEDTDDHYDVNVNALDGSILFMVGPGEGAG